MSNTEKRESRLSAFLERKDIRINWQRYGLDAVQALAFGLFASLLTGTILNTIGTQGARLAGDSGIWTGLCEAGKFATRASGPAMAISVGAALRAPRLVLFSLCAVGFAANEFGGAGGPLAVLLVTLIATEIGKVVSGETKVDILVTPLVTTLVGVGLAALLAPPLGAGAKITGDFLMWATKLQPFLMGVLVSVVTGVLLTLPISSAAICAALGLTGLAGGAAVAGCCAQMVGFAVLSFRENGVGGLVSQGIGTSMLQFENILKNPLIWLPATLASAVTGPLATCVFKLEMNGPAIAAGMGTSGLVGPIGVWTGWVNPSVQGVAARVPAWNDYLGLALLAVVLPAVLSWGFGLVFRRMGWIKPGDLTLKQS